MPKNELRGMRVLMTADTIGGVWTYAVELAGALCGEGVEVDLATLGAPLSAAQWSQTRGVHGLRIHESDFRLEWMSDPWREVAASSRWLTRLAQRLRPDLIHLNTYAHGALDWRRPLLVAGHSCVLSWWHAVHGGAPPPEYGRYHRAVCAGLANADVVIAPSRTMLNALQTHYGPLPRTRVIHNGRNPADFHAGHKEPLFLAVGRLWDAGKNVAAVAEAAGGLPWPVLVAGECRHPDGGSAALANVELLGQLAPRRLRELYATAAVYAFPARYEPFGLSVLEAALSGCALLLGDIPSLRELWDGAALFVRPDEPAAIGAAMASLAADDAQRTRLATAAQRRARRYPLDAMAASTLETYAALVGARHTAAEITREPRTGLRH